MTKPVALFEAHMRAELNADLVTTLATMVAESHLLNLGSGTGGMAMLRLRSSTPPV